MDLKGKKIVVFLEKYYDEKEFWYPYIRMREAGAEVVAVAPKKQTYHGKSGMPADPDKTIDEVQPGDFDALIIPGGYSPDHMRRTPSMIEFVREMHEMNKVVATICHGGWMLASAGIIDGKTVTSFFAIRDDVVNAGAHWVDEPVVQDGGVVTSRTPDDLPAFCRTIIELVGSS